MTNISSKSRDYIFPTIVKNRKANTALIAAVSALAAAVCGLFYCMNLAVFFDSVHFYRFSDHISLSESNFAVFIGWLSAVEVIYYTMFILLAAALVLRLKKQRMTIIFMMAALRLTTVLMMLLPGVRFAFHFGFDGILEACLLIHIARLEYSTISHKNRLQALTSTVILGTAAELIPLVRNTQCLPASGMSLAAKLSFMILPVAVMAMFFTLGSHIITLRCRSAAKKRKIHQLYPVKSTALSSHASVYTCPQVVSNN